MTSDDAAGRYRILSPIAAGGMGEVYRATMTTSAGLEKNVALKVVREDLVHGRELAELFVDEARLAMRLSHANIVQAFDVGRIDDRWFIAMELVEGTDLGQLLARSKKRAGSAVPVKHALTIAVEALKGLDYAHRRTDDAGEPLGIVHRDISPGNILVSPEGEVKVADFGVAAGMHRKGRTQDGEIKGKIAYMAPEQLRGERPDARADLYAVGAVLFELIAGRRPFAGDTPIAMIPDIVDGRRPSLLEVVPDAPEALSSIVDRALAVDRRERFPNAAAMRQELERFALSEGILLSTADLADFVHTVVVEPSEGLAKEGPRGGGTAIGLGDPLDPTTPARLGAFDLRLGEELRRVDTDEPVSVFRTRPRLSGPEAPDGSPAAGGEPLPAERSGGDDALDREGPVSRGRGVALGLVAIAVLTGAGIAAASYVWGYEDRPPGIGDHVPPIADAGVRDGAWAVDAGAGDAAPSPLVMGAPDAGSDAGASARPDRLTADGPDVVERPVRPPVERPHPPGASATVSIASDPWANVYIDGRHVGRTTLRAHRLPPGRHTIRLHNPAAGLEKTIRVDLAPGEAERLSVNLAD